MSKTLDELYMELDEIFGEDAFIKPQINRDDWTMYEDENEDTWICPSDFYEHDLDRYVLQEFENYFGVNLSTPGYVYCTEWVVFKTEEEAVQYLLETYGK